MRLTLLLRSSRVSVRLGYDEVILEVTAGPFPLSTKDNSFSYCREFERLPDLGFTVAREIFELGTLAILGRRRT